MRLLAIHHEPQECGLPFIIFVDLETGMKIPERTIVLRGSYYDSGTKFEYTYTPTGRKKTHTTYGSRPPELGKRLPYMNGCWLSTRVELVDTDKNLLTDKYEVEYSEMIKRCQTSYLSPDKDEFRVNLERHGVGMKGWNAYRRRKTEYEDFIRAVMPEEVVNVIFI